MNKNHYPIRILLWTIGIYHIAIGLLTNVSREGTLWLANLLAGASENLTDGVLYLAKPFGVYLIAFGVSMIVAAWNPLKNRAIISIAIVLFICRIIQRLLSLEEMESLFGITTQQNMISIAIVGTIAIFLVLLRVSLYREIQKTDAS